MSKFDKLLDIKRRNYSGDILYLHELYYSPSLSATIYYSAYSRQSLMFSIMKKLYDMPKGSCILHNYNYKGEDFKLYFGDDFIYDETNKEILFLSIRNHSASGIAENWINPIVFNKDLYSYLKSDIRKVFLREGGNKYLYLEKSSDEMLDSLNVFVKIPPFKLKEYTLQQLKDLIKCKFIIMQYYASKSLSIREFRYGNKDKMEYSGHQVKITNGYFLEYEKMKEKKHVNN